MLLLPTDRAAFLNYKQIIIHICPRLVHTTQCSDMSHNHCCCRKAINITCTECVSVALGIQHVQRMRCIILLSVASLAQPYFSTFPNKWHYFFFLGGGELLNMKYVFWFFSTTFNETFLILRRTKHDIINAHRSSRKVPVILVRF